MMLRKPNSRHMVSFSLVVWNATGRVFCAWSALDAQREAESAHQLERFARGAIRGNIRAPSRKPNWRSRVC
jgi:hypothetical protein